MCCSIYPCRLSVDALSRPALKNFHDTLAHPPWNIRYSLRMPFEVYHILLGYCGTGCLAVSPQKEIRWTEVWRKWQP